MPNPLLKKKIILGLTGGIACYKSAELTRRLMDYGASIQVVMTTAATQFITPTTMQALSGHPVFSHTLDARMDNAMAHINLSRQADAIIIAPASADFIAKLAHGIADDLLSTLCLARGTCPLIVVPAMNQQMWLHPATQRNIDQLKTDGIVIWGPASGAQACGEVGEGRMLEVADLVNESLSFFSAKVLQEQKVLITAGPTEEPIDPVRVISNKSSGKTGYALAQAAQRAGAHVTLVSGPTALPVPYGINFVQIHTAREMQQVVMNNIHTAGADIFIAVAAVADWYVKNAQNQKIKKGDQEVFPQLKFATNPDILSEVAHLNPAPWCVGFAAETENLLENSLAKRQRKNVPLLIGNIAQDVMSQDLTQVILVDDDGITELPQTNKQEMTVKLIHEIARRYHASLSTS